MSSLTVLMLGCGDVVDVEVSDLDAKGAREVTSEDARLRASPKLYAVHADGGLWTINPVNGVPRRARRLDDDLGWVPLMFDLPGLTALAMHPTLDLAYLATGDGDDSLYTLSLDTGALTWVADLGLGTNVHTLDFAPWTAAAHGFEPMGLYGIDIDGTQTCGVNCLLHIDTETGTVTELGALALNQGRSMSFHRTTGELWVLDSGGEHLYTIDGHGTLTYRTPIATSFPDEETGVGTSFSMAWSRRGHLYVIDDDNGVLVEIDPDTGAGEWIGAFDTLNRGGTKALQGLDASW